MKGESFGFWLILWGMRDFVPFKISPTDFGIFNLISHLSCKNFMANKSLYIISGTAVFNRKIVKRTRVHRCWEYTAIKLFAESKIYSQFWCIIGFCTEVKLLIKYSWTPNTTNSHPDLPVTQNQRWSTKVLYPVIVTCKLFAAERAFPIFPKWG